MVIPETVSEEDSDPQPVIFEMDSNRREEEPMEREFDPELMELEPKPEDDSQEEPMEAGSESDSMNSESKSSDDSSRSLRSDQNWVP